MWFFAAPHLTGFLFKLFVNMLETPLIGSSIVDSLKKNNGMTEVRFFFDIRKNWLYNILEWWHCYVLLRVVVTGRCFATLSFQKSLCLDPSSHLKVYIFLFLYYYLTIRFINYMVWIYINQNKICVCIIFSSETRSGAWCCHCWRRWKPCRQIGNSLEVSSSIWSFSQLPHRSKFILPLLEDTWLRICL